MRLNLKKAEEEDAATDKVAMVYLATHPLHKITVGRILTLRYVHHIHLTKMATHKRRCVIDIVKKREERFFSTLTDRRTDKTP